MKNKKADVGFDVVLAIPILIFLVILFLSYVFFTQAFLTTKTNTRPAEVRLYAARLLYARECLALYDEELDRTYPGIIEEDKLNDEVLENCITFPSDEHLAAKIEITKEDSSTIENFYNREKYELWSAFVGLSGEGATLEYVTEMPVVLRDKNSNNEKGWIRISILMPAHY